MSNHQSPEYGKVRQETFRKTKAFLGISESDYEELANKAAAFASNISKDRLINITTTPLAISGQTGELVITVWYWA